LLQKITDATILYLQAQVNAGADIVQIFDSWAGVLTPAQYEEFSAKYISQICDAVVNVPKIVFAKDAYFARSMWKNVNCDVVGMDWCQDIAETKAILPNKVLQGNLDPCVLYAEKQVIKREVEKTLRSYGPQGHIFNLGHGLYPDLEADKVRYMIDVVKSFRF
jgi:uroporphyrinogen decarboxylase